MSGGQWFNDYGVEGFLVANVAWDLWRALNKQKSGFVVTVEDPIAALESLSGVKPRGRRPNNIAKQGRVDIAVYPDDGDKTQPIAVIEIKRQWSPGEAKREVGRLKKLRQRMGVAKGGKLETCIVACVTAHERDADMKKIKRFYRSAKVLLKREAKGSSTFKFVSLEPYLERAKHDDRWSGGGFVAQL